MTSEGRVAGESDYVEFTRDDGLRGGQLIIDRIDTVYVDLTSARSQSFLAEHVDMSPAPGAPSADVED